MNTHTPVNRTSQRQQESHPCILRCWQAHGIGTMVVPSGTSVTPSSQQSGLYVHHLSFKLVSHYFFKMIMSLSMSPVSITKQVQPPFVTLYFFASSRLSLFFCLSFFVSRGLFESESESHKFSFFLCKFTTQVHVSSYYRSSSSFEYPTSEETGCKPLVPYKSRNSLYCDCVCKDR